MKRWSRVRVDSIVGKVYSSDSEITRVLLDDGFMMIVPTYLVYDYGE